MNVDIPKGKYILAVSGGVDSMVLLDILKSKKDLNVVIAHYDHGIRQESAKDRQFVERAAECARLVFEHKTGELGPNASEELARKKRYEFLHDMRKKHNAAAIITAHHQDDVIETMIINMLRGTHRRGLTSLKSSETILRPLLGVKKSEIFAYAHTNNIDWVEDATNSQEMYLRNYVRNHIMTKLTPLLRSELLAIHDSLLDINTEINQRIDRMLEKYKGELDRSSLTALPFTVLCELLAEVLRREHQQISEDMVVRLAVGAKTLPIGKQIVISNNLRMQSAKNKVIFLQSST